MDKTYLGRRLAEFSPGIASQPITKVELLDENGDVVGVSGSDTGRTLTALNPDGTDVMAAAILKKVSGYKHIGYEGSEALLDPAVELGDAVTVDGFYLPLIALDVTFDPMLAPNISAPDADEIDDEYPYKSPTQRQIERNMAKARSLITKTSEEIMLKVEGVDGRVTSLSTSINGIEANISSLDGSITNIKVDINNLRTTVSGKIDGSTAQSMIDQSIDKITLRVSSSNGGTTFEILSNGVVVDSTGSIDLHVDAVNIDGTLTASEIEGDTITVRIDNGRRCGYIYTEYASTADYKMTLESKAMELNATSGNLYLSGNNGRSALNFDYDFIDCRGDFAPNADNRYNLGAPNFVWSTIYCSTNELNGSDRNIKNSIEALPEKYVRMFELIEPKRYKLNNGTSGRYHAGFIAQEVEAAMQKCGITPQEFAGWAAAKLDDGSETYFLRYSEFIPILWAKVREQEARIRRLEASA